MPGHEHRPLPLTGHKKSGGAEGSVRAGYPQSRRKCRFMGLRDNHRASARDEGSKSKPSGERQSLPSPQEKQRGGSEKQRGTPVPQGGAERVKGGTDEMRGRPTMLAALCRPRIDTLGFSLWETRPLVLTHLIQTSPIFLLHHPSPGLLSRRAAPGIARDMRGMSTREYVQADNTWDSPKRCLQVMPRE